MSFKRYSSGAWADLENVKRYSGSTWADCESVKRYSSGTWTNVWAKKPTINFYTGNCFNKNSSYTFEVSSDKTSALISVYGNASIFIELPVLSNVLAGDYYDFCFDLSEVSTSVSNNLSGSFCVMKNATSQMGIGAVKTFDLVNGNHSSSNIIAYEDSPKYYLNVWTNGINNSVYISFRISNFKILLSDWETYNFSGTSHGNGSGSGSGSGNVSS